MKADGTVTTPLLLTGVCSEYLLFILKQTDSTSWKRIISIIIISNENERSIRWPNDSRIRCFILFRRLEKRDYGRKIRAQPESLAVAATGDSEAVAEELEASSRRRPCLVLEFRQYSVQRESKWEKWRQLV